MEGFLEEGPSDKTLHPAACSPGPLGWEPVRESSHGQDGLRGWGRGGCTQENGEGHFGLGEQHGQRPRESEKVLVAAGQQECREMWAGGRQDIGPRHHRHTPHLGHSGLACLPVPQRPGWLQGGADSCLSAQVWHQAGSIHLHLGASACPPAWLILTFLAVPMRRVAQRGLESLT